MEDELREIMNQENPARFFVCLVSVFLGSDQLSYIGLEGRKMMTGFDNWRVRGPKGMNEAVQEEIAITWVGLFWPWPDFWIQIFFQKARKMVLICILSVIFLLSGFRL